MLGYKLTRIHNSNQGFDFESDAIILIDLETKYVSGKVFFIKDIASDDLIPVRAEYADPKTGVIKAVTL